MHILILGSSVSCYLCNLINVCSSEMTTGTLLTFYMLLVLGRVKGILYSV